MITQRDLVQRLTRRDPGAWSVVERVRDIATVDDRHLERSDRRTQLTLIIHHDVPRGRGSARLDLDPADGSADAAIDRALALALTAVGPPWISAPPSAPAKVAVLDDAVVSREPAVPRDRLVPVVPRDPPEPRARSGPDGLSAPRELLDAARTMLARIARPGGVTTTATLELARERTTLVASSGFQTTWLATTLRADAIVALGPHRLAVTRTSRRAADLDLDDALAAAAADLRQLVDAAPLPPGPCALWLTADALLHDGDLGLWSIFALHADATVERQGLTRLHLRREVFPGASQLAEPLSITSDGALDFATRSLPITDDAVAIRRFPIVERGVVTGLGLSPREAALRHTDPNGGVRNLVVAPGSWSPASGTWPPASGTGPPSSGTGPSSSSSPPAGSSLPASSPSAPSAPSASSPPLAPSSRPAPSPSASAPMRVVEVRRIHAISIDPYTGEATLDLAFGFAHHIDPRTGHRTARAFTGGTLRLDLIADLARARRSSRLLRRGAYHGPADLFLDDALLLS